MKQQSILMIGTSPIMLLEALYHSHLGHEVVVLEKRKSYGGAWGVKDILALDRVEVGCHYLTYSPLAYNFLENYLGLNLIKGNRSFLNLDYEYLFEPSILQRLWNPLIPHQYYNSHTRKPKQLLSLFRSLVFDKDRQKWSDKLKTFLDFNPLLYPEHGIVEVLDSLMRKIETSKIKILEEEVTSISYSDKLRVTTTTETLFPDKIVLGKRALTDIVVADCQTSNFRNPKEFVHVTLLIKGEVLKSFHCIQKRGKALYLNEGNDCILRISNVGNLIPSEKKRKDTVILCVQLTKESIKLFNNHSQLVEVLKRIKLVSKSSELLESHTDYYICNDPKKDFIESLKRKLPKSIQLIESGDLCKSIEEHYHKYTHLL